MKLAFLTPSYDPREMPDAYSTMGTLKEALCFAELLRSAWVRHPEALEWLGEHKKL